MRAIKNVLHGICPFSLALFAFASSPALCLSQGIIQLEFMDKTSGDPISSRILFTKSAKKIARPKKVLFAGDQWLAEQKLLLTPPNGEFEFVVQRGPEFAEIRGGFTIEPRAKDKVPIEIPRSIDMHVEHWFSGDLLSNLPLVELHRWQMADAVDMVVSTDAKANVSEKRLKGDVSTPATTNLVGLGLGANRCHLDWGAGSLLLHGQKPSSQRSIESIEACNLLESTEMDPNTVPELIRPWSRDVPFLLATNSIRAVQILSAYNRPAGDDRLTINKEPIQGVTGTIVLVQGKEKKTSEVLAPIDKDELIRFKDARGVGKLSEAIYWQMLEAGLRITPTAGSGFQGNDTQVGYNRVYVHSEALPNEELWWQSIVAGKTFVTNGPLLRAMINGVPPGSVQTSYRSQSIPLDIAVSLAVREPVDYLDVVFNGETIYSAKLEDHYKRGEFPPIQIDKSGWLVIRVVTEHTKGYRLATTAPFYFVFDSSPRVSRKAVTFFQQWHTAAVEHIERSPDLLEIYKPWIERSSQFWERKFNSSNAD